MSGWLLLDDGPACGARNMAVDEVLLKKSEGEGGATVLRLYSFDPPAITIGYHQEPGEALDLEAAAADGLDVVRRITGGRALLHDGELTYSVTSPVGGPFGRGSAETFLTIAGLVVSALRRTGVRAGIGGAGGLVSVSGTSSPCLVSTGKYEITAGGRKVAGSAQRRAGRGFIQHGSILLRGGSERIERYLPGGWKGLAGIMTTVEAETGYDDKEAELRSHLIEVFSERLGNNPEMLVLTNEENMTIDREAAAKATEILDRGAGRL